MKFKFDIVNFHVTKSLLVWVNSWFHSFAALERVHHSVPMASYHPNQPFCRQSFWRLRASHAKLKLKRPFKCGIMWYLVRSCISAALHRRLLKNVSWLNSDNNVSIYGSSECVRPIKSLGDCYLVFWIGPQYVSVLIFSQFTHDMICSWFVLNKKLSILLLRS